MSRRSNPSYLAARRASGSPVLFHATLAANVPSIREEGLRADQGARSLWALQYHTNRRVFFTTDEMQAWRWRELIRHRAEREAWIRAGGRTRVFVPMAILEIRLPMSIRKRLRMDEIAQAEGDTTAFYLQAGPDNPVLVPPGSIEILDIEDDYDAPDED